MAISAGKSFLQQLFDYGLLIPSSVDGVYGRSGLFEHIVTGLEEAITRLGSDSPTEVMRFPPVMTRATTEQSGYLQSFPHLLGSIHSFTGDHREHRELLKEVEAQQDWSQHFTATDVVLTPAACYPIYAAATDTTVPEEGRLVDVCSYCFRHEPSTDPARMQSFRQREYVRIAAPEVVQQWRDTWAKRGLDFLHSLGLQAIKAPANDPFFGAGSRFLAASQQEQELKFELLAPVSTEKLTTPVISLNYHQDHFGKDFRIHTADGQDAHTACIGFGLERITLGLLREHGLDVTRWPAEVSGKLWR